MLISIVGPPFAGKQTVADWLRDDHGFKVVRLADHLSRRRYLNGDGGESAENTFATVEQFMDHIMADFRWQQDWVVVLRSHTIEELERIKRRPFCMVLYVDAPLLTRYHRSPMSQSLAEFSDQSDIVVFGRQKASRPLSLHADLVVVNNHAAEKEFFVSLQQISPPITCDTRLRPGWDDYFMLLADLAAYRSNCMKRRVGCIIVKDCRVIATGYNGTPRGLANCNQGGCGRCNKGEARCGQSLSECLCMHAEENALLEVGRERIGGEASLYCNTCPCLSCAKKIIQTGVREVIYRLEYGPDSASAILLKQAGVILRKHCPPMSLMVQNKS